ncbi:hypothetical protein COEREDRAFT_97726 [Coemansia reversa NRRL 1564]|uniref:tRNA(Ile)-lysidine synthetase n=1 Tax=Coemansia reversa (strain ATCC 12441 / NRRL 1564) TaxID=763665 RepID=A0A2G5BAS3_COERN|nr:hypothetical protein COEREDRAFT_97726 [Coemansia reversa NRRL 1564]|eukprot:PIA16092.1 hypothetical protein COEREDRAFT_97726 [Coemansia reversa NRRL 1564]
MALAYIVSRAVGTANCYAFTVDHGFRPESALEASDVGKYMEQLGIGHETRSLKWGTCHSDIDIDNDVVPLPPTNRLEEVARQRRYNALHRICKERGIFAVLTGHHAGDQAETFLLRFLRQSGISGLAGMRLQSTLPFGLNTAMDMSSEKATIPVLVRPLLNFNKASLYRICKNHGIRWHEDPSNSDTQFRRNALRQEIGKATSDKDSPLNADTLLKVCSAIQDHRKYINKNVSFLLAKYARLSTSLGTLELPAGIGSADCNREPPRWIRNASLCEQVLASAIAWVNCKPHPPELAHLHQFGNAIIKHYDSKHTASRKSVSAAGVMMLFPSTKRGWLFCRQPPRLGEILPQEGLLPGTTVLWDNRLLIRLEPMPGHVFRGTWRIYSLRDAEQKFSRRLAKHQSMSRQTAKSTGIHHIVQASQPVVLVDKAGSSQPQVLFARGSFFVDMCLSVSVQTLKGTADPDTREVL